ncbi:hypothetical protein AH4AK4_1745 [Aeromonas hydrophila 4AK4]|nr:hypothetical protein AH4AK4_1745 [Aeromonas hydrophila 4AK4]
MTLLMNLNENGVHYEAREGTLEAKNRAPGFWGEGGAAVGITSA